MTKKKLFIVLLALLVVLFLAIPFLVGVWLFMSVPAPIVCYSNNPAEMLVKTSQVKALANVNSGNTTIITILNSTGGDITNVKCAGSNAFNFIISTEKGCLSTVKSEAEFILKPDITSIPGTYNSSIIEISYTDHTNANREATITCRGPIIIS